MIDNKQSLKVWTLPEADSVELVSASYGDHQFPKHMHEGYSIVVVTRGVHEVNTKGQVEHLAKESILTLNPGQVHTGRAACEGGWAHMAWFPDESFIQQLLAEMDVGRKQLVFDQAMVHHKQLAKGLLMINSLMIQSNSALERESLLISGLSGVVRECGHLIEPAEMALSGQQRIQMVADHIRNHYNEKLVLDELAGLACMSKYHFLRSFSKQIGIPPHGYQNQLRINKSKSLMLKKVPLVEVAYKCGFSDQAHFSRMFKSCYGISPSIYMKAG